MEVGSISISRTRFDLTETAVWGLASQLHFLLCMGRLTLELMITEGNKQKRQNHDDPAFAL
jgi:hypothetical protein